MKIIDKKDKSSLFPAIVCAALLALIFYSFVVRVQMYMLGTSLWNDEAMLAESIVDRTMGGMLSPPLSNMQTAPALYLIVVKVFTLLFGTSEAVLRSSSFIAMIGMLAAQGVLLRKVFRVRMLFTFFSVALSSTFLYFMQHSNELKPYIGDATFFLCVLLGYYAYREGFLGLGVRGALLLSGILIVAMLFSTPAAFAAGAVFVVEFLLKCRRKDRAAILLIVLSGAVFVAAFALNYMLWLKPIAEDAGMVGYWDGFKLSFNVLRGGAMQHNYELLKDMLSPVWQTAWVTVPFAVCGFVISLSKRNVYTLVAGVFFVLLVAANAIDKYPIANRLWLFIYVVFFIYIFVFIDTLSHSFAKTDLPKAAKIIIPLLFSFLLLAPNFSFPAYGKGEEWTLTPGDQAKPLIEYVRENIREGETLYSYDSANVILKYENGYHTNRIGNVSGDNIIYGSPDYDMDVETIDRLGSAYVLYYHSYLPLSGDFYVDYTIEQLQKRGYMDAVMDVYYTPLYWFTNDFAQVRASASAEIEWIDVTDGRLTGTLLIHNTGSTLLSHGRFEGYGPLYLVLREVGAPPAPAGAIDGTVLSVVEAPIKPGETRPVWIETKDFVPGEYQIDLVAIGEYYFSELGMEPIPVIIDN